MAKCKLTENGLLLYYSTLDCIEMLDDKELGNFIKNEMRWLSGKTDEPQYETIGSTFLHSRIKEQISVRDKKAEEMRKYRDKINKQETPKPKEKSKPKTHITAWGEEVVDYDY